MGTPHYHPCHNDCPNGLTAGYVARHGGRVDVITEEGDHLYWSTHCRHGNHDACSATSMVRDRATHGPSDAVPRPVEVLKAPAQCKTCAAPCRCGCHEGGTEWAPGAGWARIRREMPDVVPDLTDEDMRKADEIIAQAEATVDPTAEAFAAAFKQALARPLHVLPPSQPTRAEIRAAVFAELRANLDQINGATASRPHYGGGHLVHRRSQVEEWLDRQERIEKEERRG